MALERDPVAAVIQAGTYRAADGRLVHVRWRRDQRMIVEAEPERHDLAASDLVRLVKLSDDPNWPDLELPIDGLAQFD